MCEDLVGCNLLTHMQNLLVVEDVFVSVLPGVCSRKEQHQRVRNTPGAMFSTMILSPDYRITLLQI